MQFYEPESFRTQHKSNRQASNDEYINPNLSSSTASSLVPVSPHYASDAVKLHHQKSIELFESLIKSGVCREQARGVLPQNLYTQYYGTTDLHNLLKFVSLRVHKGAQWEIQQVAKACLQIAEEFFPHSVASYRSHKGDI